MLIFRLLLSAFVIGLLLRHFDFAASIELVGHASPFPILAAVSMFCAQFIFSINRWTALSKLMEMPIGWKWAFNAFAVGYLFNQVLPSSIGGDAVRVWLLKRRNFLLSKCVSNIFLDRLIALVMLATMGAISLPFLLERVSEHNILFSLGGGMFLVISGLGFLFILGGPRAAPYLARTRLTRALYEVARSLRELTRSPCPLIPVLLWTLASHSCVVGSVYFLGISLDAGLDITGALIVVPPMMLLSALPVSFGGWGIREGAIVVMLTTLGVQESAAGAVALLFASGVLLMSLPGAYLFATHKVTFRKEEPDAPADPLQELQDR